jgi:hypothetical protein
MIPPKTDAPKVFISYSWTSVPHENWVLNLAERLSSDGVWIKIDKWDLKEGQDKYAFMEGMVKDSGIIKVLLICDKKYKEKADERKGGVGTESQIISEEIYNDVKQEKFISIIKELGDKGQPCLPTFVKSRVYIDFSEEDKFEESYEKLLRNIFDKPLYKRPSLGTPPNYITEEEPILIKTSIHLRKIRDAIEKNNPHIEGLIRDFCSIFIESLEEYRIKESTGEPPDEIIVKNIEKFLPFRDDFISFCDLVYKYNVKFNAEIIINLLENLQLLLFEPLTVKDKQYWHTDNFRFINYELFLCLIATLLNYEKYSDASLFINNTYYFKDPYLRNIESHGFSIFNQYVEFLDRVRNERLNFKLISFTAQLIIQRANHRLIPEELIKETDFILFSISLFQLDVDKLWFPRLYIYMNHVRTVPLLKMMISKRYFEKIKILFVVNDLEQFKKRIKEIEEQKILEKSKINRDLLSIYYRLPDVKEIFDLERICTML